MTFLLVVFLVAAAALALLVIPAIALQRLLRRVAPPTRVLYLVRRDTAPAPRPEVRHRPLDVPGAAA